MGYDVTRFISEIDEEFLCSICAMVLENPLQTPCDHLFCSDCVNGWLSINKTCPVDRKPSTISDLEPINRTVRNLLSKLEIKCDFHSNAIPDSRCNKIGKLVSLHLHITNCEYNPDSEMMSDKGCNLKISRIDYQENSCLTHLAVSHEQEIIKLIHELSNQKEHYELIVYHQQEEIKKLSDEMKRLYQIHDKYEVIAGHQQLQIASFNDKSRNLNTSKWGYPLVPGNSSFKIQLLKGQFVTIGLTFKGVTIHSSKDYFICYHVSDGQLEDQSICELIEPKCTIGDIIEMGIKLPLDCIVSGEYVRMYLSINECVVVEKLIIMPNLELYPSIGVWGEEVQVKYFGIAHDQPCSL